MMMELMDCDLHRVIQSKQSLSEKHHKCFMKQLLEGIKAMHSVGCFHRDLKPGNILVSKDCQLRITDFGLARFMDESTRAGENEAGEMTQYVVTRWYRPPELLLAPNLPYREAVDLWSCGCILAELFRRKPLFPGKTHLNQAQLIFECFGFASTNELGFPVSTEAAQFLDKKCRYKPQSLKKLVPEGTDSALQLIEALLFINPSSRPSAEQALKFPFLEGAELLHDYSKVYLERPTSDFFEFEQTKCSVPELRRMIEHEVELCSAIGYKQVTSSRHDSPITSSPHQPTIYQDAPVGYIPDIDHDLPDGPASQLPTAQTRKAPTGIINGKGNKDNPFRAPSQVEKDGIVSGRVQPQDKTPKAIDDIGIAATTYRDLVQQQQKPAVQKQDGKRIAEVASYDDVTGIPIHAIPEGNILTAVRNEAPPAHIPPGSRMKTPKSPSPHKVDQILQKDIMNKRRFMIEQGALNNDSSNSLTSRSANTQSDDSRTSHLLPTTNTTLEDMRKQRSNVASSTFHKSNPSAPSTIVRNAPSGPDKAVAAPLNYQQAGGRFSRMTPSIPNFPSFASRITNMGIGAGNYNSRVSSRRPPGGVPASGAMMHSGSNVIHSEHPPLYSNV